MRDIHLPDVMRSVPHYTENHRDTDMQPFGPNHVTTKVQLSLGPCVHCTTYELI